MCGDKDCVRETDMCTASVNAGLVIDFVAALHLDFLSLPILHLIPAVLPPAVNQTGLDLRV